MNRRQLAFISLFISEIGDSLFLSSLAVYLLHQGYSAMDAGSALAATTIPNALLGPWLGRWVDRSNKLMLFWRLSLALSLGEFALLLVTGGIKGLESFRSAGWVVPVLMIAMAVVYSPLQTLIQQYLIPKMEKNEADAYSRWETYHTAAVLLGSSITFGVLLWLDPKWLIVADAFTFVLSALMVVIAFRRDHSLDACVASADLEDRKISWSRIATFLENPQLRTGVASMLGYALLVVSVLTNIVPTGARIFELSPAFQGLLISFLGFFQWSGAMIFKRVSKKVGDQLARQNLLFLNMHLVPLTLMAVATLISSLWLWAIAIALMGLLASPWAVTNTLLLRSNLPKQGYAEFFGILRMPRAVLTLMSTSGFAWTIDAKLASPALGLMAIALIVASMFIVPTLRLSQRLLVTNRV